MDPAAAAAWFEDRYRDALTSGRMPSWADLRPNPNLTDWLETAKPRPGRAAVVGCGYGDDAAVLARAGFDVTAFDVARTAVAEAAKRFLDVPVTWRVADLFDLPGDLLGAFDLVVEIFTIQTLPLDLRPRALAGVASLLAPGGTLFLLCRGRDAEAHLGDTPPWPLAAAELDIVDGMGLKRLSFEDFADPHEDAQPRRFRAVWRRG